MKLPDESQPNGFRHRWDKRGVYSLSLSERKISVTSTYFSVYWRRRRDSNPRDPFGSNGFQDRRIQPLCHSSTLILLHLLATCCTLATEFDVLLYSVGDSCSQRRHFQPEYGLLVTKEYPQLTIQSDYRSDREQASQMLTPPLDSTAAGLE